jgi:hypothetical protein
MSTERLDTSAAPTADELEAVRSGDIADPVIAGQILQRHITSRAPVAWEGTVVSGLLHEIHRLRQTIVTHRETVESLVDRDEVSLVALLGADGLLWSGMFPPAPEPPDTCCGEGGCGICE